MSKKHTKEQVNVVNNVPIRIIIYLSILLVTWLVIAVYHITDGMRVFDLHAIDQLIVPHWRGHLNPEFNERSAFIAFIIVAPLVPFLLAILFFKRTKWTTYLVSAERHITKVSWIMLLAFVSLFLVNVNLNHFFLFETMIFDGFNLIVALVIFLFICKYQSSPKIRLILIYIFSIVCIAITVLTFFLMLWGTNSRYESTGHYVAYTASIAAILYGDRTLFFGFFNQYGFYSYLLAPIFRVIHFNVRNFSILMGLLMIVAFVCNYLTLKILVKDVLIRLLLYFNVVFWTVYYNIIVLRLNDVYYQYFPHRYLFPSICMLLFVRYIDLIFREEKRREEKRREEKRREEKRREEKRSHFGFLY